jgi:hypothetical protein
MRHGQSQLNAEHCAGELGDEFLGGIGRCAEAVLEIAPQTAGIARPVRKLVSERGVVVIETIEQVGRRHRDPISGGFVVSLATLMTQIDRNGGEEGVELGLTPFRLDQFERCGRMEALGQTFHLIGIEDRIGFQHPASFIGLFAGIGGFHLFGVALVEDRDGRLLALADLAAERLRLIVGHPERRDVTAHVGNHPEPEHIHAAVWNAAGPQGPRNGYAAPRLDPRLRASLQTGDDFFGDAGGGRHAAALPLAMGHDGSPDCGIRTVGDQFAGQCRRIPRPLCSPFKREAALRHEPKDRFTRCE